jgi:thiamine biosynthesis lipoprotein
MVAPALFVAGLFAVYLLRQGPDTGDRRELAISGPTMGTAFSVKVVTDDVTDAHRERLAATLHEVLDDVNGSMSTYRAESEIEAFNNGGTEPFPASAQLLEVVAEAQRVSRLSGGAFDITVGPLVDRWGFGPSGGATDAPGEDELQRLLAATGFAQLELDSAVGTLAKARPEIRIDLSAIAKGHAVDRLSTTLSRQGLTDHMVEVGGEVRARGVNASGQPWRIGIERPTVGGRSLHTAVALADMSLATSGDYRNFFERDGVRYSHTIDPRTGRPVSHGLASVSVIHPTCMTADALATALEVLGPVDGFELAEAEGVAALFLMRTEDDGVAERPTRAWAAAVENAASAPPVE